MYPNYLNKNVGAQRLNKTKMKDLSTLLTIKHDSSYLIQTWYNHYLAVAEVDK